jgi:hypothetical protein
LDSFRWFHYPIGFGDRWLQKWVLLGLLWSALAQPHSGAPAVFVDEFDARSFECSPDNIKCCKPGLTIPGFELMHSNNADSSLFSELVLAPR